MTTVLLSSTDRILFYIVTMFSDYVKWYSVRWRQQNGCWKLIDFEKSFYPENALFLFITNPGYRSSIFLNTFVVVENLVRLIGCWPLCPSVECFTSDWLQALAREFFYQKCLSISDCFAKLLGCIYKMLWPSLISFPFCNLSFRFLSYGIWFI